MKPLHEEALLLRPSRGRPPAGRALERDCALLDTASQLFLEHGFAQVSIDQIARSARVATRTIYTRFGGKKGLLGKILERDSECTRLRLANITDMLGEPAACLRELALLCFERAALPASHLLYCDIVAERDFALASQIDLMQNGPWRQCLELVLSHATWRSFCTFPCAPTTIRDLFIGCIVSTKCESANPTSASGTTGQEAGRLADEATQRFFAALA